jgi:UDP-3-O-[3-hydroxymyristoyl] glucosamine N-acyltransferase
MNMAIYKSILKIDNIVDIATKVSVGGYPYMAACIARCTAIWNSSQLIGLLKFISGNYTLAHLCEDFGG